MKDKRVIYQEPRERDMIEKQFEWLINMNNGMLTEQDLAESLQISQREVRFIAERYNNFKFLDYDNKCRYSKINGTYQMVVANTPLGNQELARGRSNFIADCKRHWNREKMLGSKYFANMTIREIVGSDEEVE
jgi:DNA-directed RNA polymerase specialized sigma subunit